LVGRCGPFRAAGRRDRRGRASRCASRAGVGRRSASGRVRRVPRTGLSFKPATLDGQAQSFLRRGMALAMEWATSGARRLPRAVWTERATGVEV